VAAVCSAAGQAAVPALAAALQLMADLLEVLPFFLKF